MLIDAHCHINSLGKNTLEDIVTSSKENPRLCYIDSSIDMPTSLSSIALSQHYDCIYTSLGFHPFSAQTFSEEIISTYEKFIDEHRKIVAIGEVGLDYKASSPAKQQEAVFESCIRLAKRKQLPIIIHNRFDNPRLLQVLDAFCLSYEKVMFHCFSYGPDMLSKIIEKRGIVSFSLNILRKNADIIESLRQCPLENLLLETDSPYMKIKGSLSTPLDINKVYEKAAKIKDVDIDYLVKQVQANIARIFSINAVR